MATTDDTPQSPLQEMLGRAFREAFSEAQSGTAPPLKWLDNNQAARRLGRAPETLQVWRSTKRGPPFVGKGRMVRYSVDALDEFMANGGVA